MSNKRVALYDYIAVDGVALSSFARSVQFSSTDEQVDVSGFNATGVDEFPSPKSIAQELTTRPTSSVSVAV